MRIENSNFIYNCYKNKIPFYNSTDQKAYQKEYYQANKLIINNYMKNYNMIHKERLKRLKAIWFQRNKERLRIKWGYKRRNKTKTKNILNPPVFIKKTIVLDFS